MYLRASIIFLALAFLLGLRFQKHHTVNPYDDFRDLKNHSSGPLVVDLGYEIYEGYHNQSTGLNIWKGYATHTIIVSVPNLDPESAMQLHRPEVLDSRNLKYLMWIGAVSCLPKDQPLNVPSLIQPCKDTLLLGQQHAN